MYVLYRWYFILNIFSIIKIFRAKRKLRFTLTPACRSRMATQQPNTLQRASVCGGAAAAQYEVAVKDMKFGEQCKAAGLMLVPMVVEVFGTWGERSEEVFKLVSKVCANKASEKAKAAGAHIRRSLSVCLQRLNARILLSRANPLAEVFGEPVDMPYGHDTHSSRADEVAEMVAALDAAPAAMTEAVSPVPVASCLMLTCCSCALKLCGLVPGFIP